MDELEIKKLSEMVKCPCWSCDPRGFKVAAEEALNKAYNRIVKNPNLNLLGGFCILVDEHCPPCIKSLQPKMDIPYYTESTVVRKLIE